MKNYCSKGVINLLESGTTLKVKTFRFLKCNTATHRNIALSLIKSSTAERFPNTMFIMMKNRPPVLKYTKTMGKRSKFPQNLNFRNSNLKTYSMPKRY